MYNGKTQYASAVWDPGGVNDIKRIESLQSMVRVILLKSSEEYPTRMYA